MHSNRLVKLLLVLGAATFGLAAAQVGSLEWRALYSGEADAAQVTVDLQVFEGGAAFARLWQGGMPVGLSGHGRLEDDGRLELTFHLPRARDNGPWEAESVLLDAALAEAVEAGEAAELPYDGYEVEPFGSVIARLSGLARIEWDADHDPIAARLTFYEATAIETEPPSPAREHELTLRRLALFSEARLRQGRIEAEASFPYFVRGEFQRVNSFMESRQRQAVDEFVAFARESLAGDEGFGGWGMAFDEQVFVTGQAGGFLSLLGFTYTFTGGAHGNTFADSYLLEVDGGNLVRWQVADLFAADSDWVSVIGPLVLADLATQDASWVTEGDVVELSERDLRVATLGPEGITFHFDPYHMGPYAQGGFEVTLAYAEVIELAVPEGALAAFAREFSPPSSRL